MNHHHNDLGEKNLLCKTGNNGKPKGMVNASTA